MLKPLDVILIPDETIRPPKPKMVVCIQPFEGWFYRINSNDWWKPCVKIHQDPHHPFLRYDSYLECGDPLELSDYIIEDVLRRKGLIGKIHMSYKPAIIDCLEQAKTLNAQDKFEIIKALT